MNDSPEAVVKTSKIVASSMRLVLPLTRKKLGLNAVIVVPAAFAPGVEIVAILGGAEASVTDHAKVCPSPDKTAPHKLSANQAQTLDASIFNARAADNLLQDLQFPRSLIEDDRASLVWNDRPGSDLSRAPWLRTHTAVGFGNKMPRITPVNLAAGCVTRFGTSQLAILMTDCYRRRVYEHLSTYGLTQGIGIDAVQLT